MSDAFPVRGSSGAGLTGLRQMISNLDMLRNKVGIKAAKAGVLAGLQVLVKNLRSAVNASSASVEMKSAARKTISKSLKKPNVAGYVGKFGFGVGKQAKGKKAKAKARAGDKTKSGVGISSSNIHWAALGTKKRIQEKFQRLTGAMPAEFKGLIAQVACGSDAEVMVAASTKMQQVIDLEVARLGKS
jgi:hypothetical protein